jgi:hypothetical protein
MDTTFKPREGDEHVHVETHDSLPTSFNKSAWGRFTAAANKPYVTIPADRPLVVISDETGAAICTYDAVTDTILPPDAKAVDIMRVLSRVVSPLSPSKSPGDGGQVEAGEVEKP